MRKTLLLLLAFAAPAIAADKSQQPDVTSTWYHPPHNPKAELLSRISVKGNRFVDSSGQPVLFRGLSLADPDRLVKAGQWSPAIFAAAKDCGANLIRLPVHPAAWRERGKAGYLALLDQAVDWCTDLGIHVIIDWHSIGNLQTEMFQDPGYVTSKPETFDFWRTIAQHFHGNHTVAFYELFNEPTQFGGMLGTMTWTEWRELNEQMIVIIRYYDRDAVPLVAGFDWAYDLTGFRYEPIRAQGIGFVTHPYANKRTRPWEPKWEEDFGFMADSHPMIATEIGFEEKDGETITDDSYGNRITRYLESRGISWVAWVFDPNWGPRMLKSFDGFQLRGDGAFFKEAMHRAPAPIPPPAKQEP